MGEVTVIGVRHHSPACARLVRHVLRAVRPATVLIEGPADLNGRLAELLLDHEPPLAVFTWYRDGERRHASWTPFCAYSPEWVALREGAALGARVRFADLPAWHPAFAGVQNRYADPGELAAARYRRLLLERTGLDGYDALWDHLFEQPAEPDVLRERLDRYFAHLRDGAAPSERDAPREAFLRRWIGWARAQGGDVVVVCGGWHQPALSGVEPIPGDEPPVDAPADGSAHDSWLVPFGYRRLDAFAGYQSGMPSPAWYEAVWELGPEAAPERVLQAAIAHLRRKGIPASTADLVGLRTSAEALARLRGHVALARTDILDALAGALVKTALEVPLPWSRRGPLLAGTDPVLVEVVSVFSGSREGRLAAGTPEPPLAADLRRALAEAGVAPARRPRGVDLGLRDPADLARSRVLHRVRVLGVPGFERRSGPTRASEATWREAWSVASHPHATAAILEAGGWGPTLESAAAARLEAQLGEAGGAVGRLAELLGDAVAVGISTLADSALQAVALAVGRTVDLSGLGAATTELLAQWRHGDLLGATGARLLAGTLAAAAERLLWLVEGVSGPDAPAERGHLVALVALRDVARAGLVDRPLALAVLGRRARDPAAPPALRGAALGFAWSLGERPAGDAAARAVRAAATPERFGDFLAGLFALARDEVTAEPALAAELDAALVGFDEHGFLVALPSLRMAFAWLPPAERARLARRVLARHGADPDHAADWLALDVAPAVVARGLALERRVEALVERYGLGPVEEAP